MPLIAAQGKHAEAEEIYERVQATQEKTLGPEHQEVANSLNRRAVMLINQVRAGQVLSAFVVMPCFFKCAATENPSIVSLCTCCLNSSTLLISPEHVRASTPKPGLCVNVP